MTLRGDKDHNITVSVTYNDVAASEPAIDEMKKMQEGKNAKDSGNL
jgi:hypothetical protein